MALRYRAFIVFDDADRAIGESFARAVERYRFPAPVRGTDFGRGRIPERLAPLTRARASQAASDEARAALADSAALVVLCSPAAARSEPINELIRAYKKLGREEHILAVLAEGAARRFDAQSASDGALPPALFERYNSAGVLVTMAANAPLVGNLRAEGDGARMAKLELLAALTGAPVAQLTHLQQAADRRERMGARWLAAIIAGLALLAAGAAAATWTSEQEARARLEGAIELAAQRVDDAARFGAAYGVPAEALGRMLAESEAEFEALIGARGMAAPAMEVQRGRVLTRFSRLHGLIGDEARQLELAREAVTVLDAAPAARSALSPSSWLGRLPSPGELARVQLEALAALGEALGASDEAGETLTRGRDLARAAGARREEARFEALLGARAHAQDDFEAALAAQSAALDLIIAAGGEGAGVESARARAARAETLLALGRGEEALAEQNSAVEAFSVAAADAPADADARRELAFALSRQGELQGAVSGEWARALPALERAAQILAEMRAADPARMDYARQHALVLELQGDARANMRDTARAGALYSQLLDLRRDLLARDPQNAEAQRALAGALARVGDAALAQGRPADALSAFDESRMLRARAGAGGDESADDALDMARLWRQTAIARRRVGESEDWPGAYNNSIRLMRPVADAEGAAPEIKRELSALYLAYGDELGRSNRRAQAQRQWRAGLARVEAELALNSEDAQLNREAARLRARLE